ncbi:nitroreductase family protein [Desulfosarcina sp. OttesenSCG-928-A07]|nr:nitroreductase family protein [Desulfosarcina sp. OttesenSCG-928-G17]MDL2328602.1 nitroreductase family protein [Desulfosarcina sp. OttesenSCG-928-A07]
MSRETLSLALLFAVAVLFVFSGTPVLAADAVKADVIVLPTPQTTGGKPLMEALFARRSDRVFSDADVSLQETSNLLWATWGINRKDGQRTAPTAKNTQAVEVYVVLENGVWRYDAVKNILGRVLDQNVTTKVGDAPMTLLYAAPEKDPFAGMHVGSLYQNAGLYCASAGLSNVVKNTGARALDGILTLPDGYKIFILQSVGWPKNDKPEDSQ